MFYRFRISDIVKEPYNLLQNLVFKIFWLVVLSFEIKIFSSKWVLVVRNWTVIFWKVALLSLRCRTLVEGQFFLGFVYKTSRIDVQGKVLSFEATVCILLSIQFKSSYFSRFSCSVWTLSLANVISCLIRIFNTKTLLFFMLLLWKQKILLILYSLYWMISCLDNTVLYANYFVFLRHCYVMLCALFMLKNFKVF